MSDHGPLGVRWVWAFLDRPAEGFEDAVAFWSAVTRSTPSARRGEHAEFLTLLPDAGAPWVKVQRVGGPAGTHLDLDVDVPLPQARDHAVSVGADVLQERDDVVVCRSPGGYVFCLTRFDADETGAGQVRDGADSLLDQVCLDIPSGAWDTEVAFWSVLTGWAADDPDPQDEFGRLACPAGLPVRFLLQRLDEADGPVRAHVDLASVDREREVARHVALGATRGEDGRGWTVLTDPVGAAHCVTDRHPDRERQTRPS